MQLVIPALNEERRLPATLEALRAYAVSTRALPHPPLEVIVVDNGSHDRTALTAVAADSPLMPVRVVSCPVRGKGAAVAAGVAATTADVVGFMDADGATALEAFARAEELLRAGADVAIGSRQVEGAVIRVRHNWLRATGARVHRRAALALVPGMHDTQCGFKVMRGDLARALFAATRTRGWSFDVELLARAQAAGARIAEFPVTWIDVPGSTFSPMRHGVRSLTDLASISRRLRAERRIAAPTPLPLPAPAAAPLDLAQGAS